MIRYPVADGAPEVSLGWAPSACLGTSTLATRAYGYVGVAEPGAGSPRSAGPRPTTPRYRGAPGGDMRHEDNAPPPEEWSVSPHPCGNCAPHSWHAVPCMDCFCETSCLAPVIVIPGNITLGTE